MGHEMDHIYINKDELWHGPYILIKKGHEMNHIYWLRWDMRWTIYINKNGLKDGDLFKEFK